MLTQGWAGLSVGATGAEPCVCTQYEERGDGDCGGDVGEEDGDDGGDGDGDSGGGGGGGGASLPIRTSIFVFFGPTFECSCHMCLFGAVVVPSTPRKSAERSDGGGETAVCG